MRLDRLKEKEEQFLSAYPEGFSSPELAARIKKHQIPKYVQFAQEELSPESFKDVDGATDSLLKLLTRSTLISIFEKTAFRNHLKGLTMDKRHELVHAYRVLLHEDRETGFEGVVGQLQPFKLDKWPIVTAPLYYLRPEEDLIVKPTTVKAVIAYFELDGVSYHARPQYNFYTSYRQSFMALKNKVNPILQTENGAFSGFLMYAIGMWA